MQKSSLPHLVTRDRKRRSERPNVSRYCEYGPELKIKEPAVHRSRVMSFVRHIVVYVTAHSTRRHRYGLRRVRILAHQVKSMKLSVNSKARVQLASFLTIVAVVERSIIGGLWGEYCGR